MGNTTYYTIVGFNTEAYEPEDIANIADLYPSYDAALNALKVIAEEDESCIGEDADWGLNEDQGTLLHCDGHRGYYIQKTFVRV